MKDQTDPMNRPGHPLTATNPTHGGGEARHEHGNRAEKESSCGELLLLEKVLERDNLLAAWKQVKANRGAPGIDGMNVGAFPEFIRKHWERIRQRIMDGSYRPAPVRRVTIPKPDGTRRELGIPTVLDRVIQQAIAQALTPLYDPTFSEHSHGFRPGRSAHDAVEEMQREGNRKRPRAHVVDCDLHRFFDTVDHGKLMNRLRERIRDVRLLHLIGRYLKAGVVLPEGTFEETWCGVPQGGPLSPLLANILLDELDYELEARGHRFVRYADDFVILCKSPRAGRRILESVKRYLQKRMKLMVNQAKSRVVKLSESSFLGFQIIRGKVRWSGRSQAKFKEAIQKITKRTRGISPSTMLEELRLYVRGAVNYYEKGMHFREAREMDSWLRRRVRLYYWKQWGRPRTRRRNLIRLGANSDEVKMATRSRKGPWRMSANSIVHRALNNAWLSAQGVPSIEQQWINIRYPENRVT